MTTNTNSTLRDEVLASINAIDEAVVESDMSVTLALIDASEKAMMIMENYTGEDVDAFSFFQEANKWDPKHPFKEDNALMTIVRFIPNLIRLIINKLDKLFNGDRRSNLEKIADAVKSGGPKVANLIGQLGEIADNHKTELIIGGTAISIAGIEFIWKPIRTAIQKARKAIVGYDNNDAEYKVKDGKGEYDGKKVASLEGIRISKDGTGYDTIIDFKAMGNWFSRIQNTLKNYDGTFHDLKDAKTAENYNKTLQEHVNDWNNTKGFRQKEVHITWEEFKNIWESIEKQVGDVKKQIDANVAAPKKNANESDSDEMKKIRNLTSTIEGNMRKLQDMVGKLQAYFGATSDISMSVESGIKEAAKHFGLPFGTLKDAAVALVDRVKDWAGKFKTGNVNDDPELKKDLEGGEYGLSDSKKKTKTDTPATTDFSTDDLNPDEEMTASKKDIKNVNVVKDSYEGTIDDDDTVVLESVEYTKDLQTIEKTAKTVDEVNKLKAETFSSVKNVKYKAGKKALIIEGYSKIKHDTGKIKKPKDDETWDDVDMSAHDRRDPVRLIITGPGAEAYAESKKGGKKVVGECGDAGCSPKTVTESPDTSWYYTR